MSPPTSTIEPATAAVTEQLPAGIIQTLEESVDAIDLAAREADILLAACDPALLDRLSDGRVGC